MKAGTRVRYSEGYLGEHGTAWLRSRRGTVSGTTDEAMVRVVWDDRPRMPVRLLPAMLEEDAAAPDPETLALRERIAHIEGVLAGMDGRDPALGTPKAVLSVRCDTCSAELRTPFRAPGPRDTDLYARQQIAAARTYAARLGWRAAAHGWPAACPRHAGAFGA